MALPFCLHVHPDVDRIDLNTIASGVPKVSFLTDMEDFMLALLTLTQMVDRQQSTLRGYRYPH